MRTKIKRWACSCGFRMNGLRLKECDNCGKKRRKNAPVVDHIVVSIK